MKIENQVCSVRQAKIFYEYGIRNAYLSWTLDIYNNCWALSNLSVEHGELYNLLQSTDHVFYPAFSVAELGEMLPNELDLSHGNYFFTKQGQWHSYESVQGIVLKEWQGTEKEGIRRAEILIDLLELCYTTPEEVNNRLLKS